MTPKARIYAARMARAKARTGSYMRGKAWYAMRVLRQFTCAELMAVIESENKHSVLTFLGQLRRTGYLRAVYGNGGRHEPTRFTLIRDSGPTCPALVHRGTAIYDHNTDTEYPLK